MSLLENLRKFEMGGEKPWDLQCRSEVGGGAVSGAA